MPHLRLLSASAAEQVATAVASVAMVETSGGLTKREDSDLIR